MSSRNHKRRRRLLRPQLGFSLVEVLIFLTILSLVFITAATVATISIQNSKSAENRILAARYGQELMDWLHGQKENGWDDFIKNYKLSYEGDHILCFNTEPINIIGTDHQPCTNLTNGNGDPTVFQRQVTLTYDSTLSRITVKVDVKWQEGTNSFNTPINSIFAPFE